MTFSTLIMKLECSSLKCNFKNPKIIIAVIKCIQRGCTTENTWIYTNVQICATFDSLISTDITSSPGDKDINVYLYFIVHVQHWFTKLLTNLHQRYILVQEVSAITPMAHCLAYSYCWQLIQSMLWLKLQSHEIQCDEQKKLIML